MKKKLIVNSNMPCTHSIMALSYSSTRRGYTAMYPSQRQNLINRSIDLYRDKYKEIVNVRKKSNVAAS